MVAPSPSFQVALAVFGLLAVAAVGAIVLPQAPGSVEHHQLPGVPGAPGAPGAPSAPGSPVDADPIELVGDLASGQASSVRIYSPNDHAVTLVQLTSGPAGTSISLYGAPVVSVPGAGAPILVQGDVVRDPVVTFTVNPAGQAPVLVRVDRSQTPAIITMGEKTVTAPLSFTGPATDPSEVAVYDVTQAAPQQQLLRYTDHGNGSSSVTFRNATGGQETIGPVFHQLITLNGSPLGPTFGIVVRDATGRDATRIDVPVGTVQAALKASGADTGPFLTIARGAQPGVNAYKAATDGERTIDMTNLTGQRWLNGQATQKVVVDVPRTQDLGTPALLLDRTVPVPGSSLQVAMARSAEQNGFIRYTGQVPATWLTALPDGATVHFSIAYRLAAAKLVTEQRLDDNHGAAYRYRSDRAGPVAPTLTVTTPDAAKPEQLSLAWSASDAASGVASYEVERGRVLGAQVTWESLSAATKAERMDFTGERGTTYQFRARATDLVGIAGGWGTSNPVAIPGAQGEGGVNRAPTVQIIQPTGGEAFAGVPELVVKWRASDPDGTTPLVTLSWSRDAGATWQALATPTGSSYDWDIAQLQAGDYRLKVEATDGSLSTADASGKFHIDNSALATADSIGGPNPQQPLTSQAPATPTPTGDAPARTQGPAAPLEGSVLIIAGIALVAVGVTIAVLKLRRR